MTAGVPYRFKSRSQEQVGYNGRQLVGLGTGLGAGSPFYLVECATKFSIQGRA
jgi:hypothetical protein